MEVETNVKIDVTRIKMMRALSASFRPHAFDPLHEYNCSSDLDLGR